MERSPKMKIEKRQTVMEGEIKVLKDTVWRLTTRVYGLEEQIKEMKTKLKMTMGVESRYSVLTAASPMAPHSSSRKSSKTVVSATCTRSSSRVKERQVKGAVVKVEGSKKKSPSSSSKTRQIAVKKTTRVDKAPRRRLEHQSVITQRGRRATSFKLHPSDDEKEVFFVSDSSDDAEGQTDKKVKCKSSGGTSAAEDFMKVLNEGPSGDYNTIEAHDDLIVFPTPTELPIGIAVGQEDTEQLPLKKRRLDNIDTCDEPQSGGMDLYEPNHHQEPTVEDHGTMDVPVSYIHQPPESFSCFFCGQQFPTDEERAVHSRIHAGASKKT